MGKVIRLDDYRFPWREAFTHDGPATTVQVYANDLTGEIELVQLNDANEAIHTVMKPEDVALLRVALAAAEKKAHKR